MAHYWASVTPEAVATVVEPDGVHAAALMFEDVTITFDGARGIATDADIVAGTSLLIAALGEIRSAAKARISRIAA